MPTLHGWQKDNLYQCDVTSLKPASTIDHKLSMRIYCIMAHLYCPIMNTEESGDALPLGVMQRLADLGGHSWQKITHTALASAHGITRSTCFYTRSRVESRHCTINEGRNLSCRILRVVIATTEP